MSEQIPQKFSPKKCKKFWRNPEFPYLGNTVRGEVIQIFHDRDRGGGE